ncbi:hypothetical protein PSQ19_15830 [Devosia algicola]|uniref:DUF2171 domain-containing protein n=1 Tax=Devosia algicola TaxID=3026418 RepID=A0ABY7YLI2_9HYPH|nr:hypothetical protein [Devosia algicola]WDR02116.1 hypothetical protein PSQ19_15830 [Devosia algicola]
MIEGRRRFRGFILEVDDEAVTIRLPDAPAGADPNHRLPLAMLADAKLVMSDTLMDMARKAQEENNPLDDDDIETETDEMPDDFDDEDQPGTDDDDKSSKEIH